MKSFTLVTLLACALVQTTLGAAIADERNEEVTDNIDLGIAMRMFYTSFQRIMPCGAPNLKIPVLAPFTLNYLPINFANKSYSVSGHIADLEVTGLNNFRILTSKFNASTNHTSKDIIFPEVHILGKYQVDAEINIAGLPVKSSGNGLINVKIQDFRKIAEFVMGPSSKNPNGVEVTNPYLRYYLGGVVNNNWNNEWDIAVNNFINKFINEGVSLWFQEVQKKIDVIFSEKYLPKINQYLQNLSMQDVLNAFVYYSAQFDVIECESN